MQRTPKILIVGPEVLESELAAALKGLPDTAAVLHHAPDYRIGAEMARTRQPELVLATMTTDLRGLTAFAQEVGKACPHTSLAAVFSPEIFGPDVSESAVIIEALRAGMQDFLRRPLSRIDVAQLLERLYRKQTAQAPGRLGSITSFISNKGGVGKSTVSCNTAVALAARHPDRVLLVDGSLQMGVCAALLDLKPATTLLDAAQQCDRLDETLLRQLAMPHSTGLHLLAAPADAIEATHVTDEVMTRVLTLARRAYDIVIVDTFPMLDQVMVAILDLSDRAYVVLESVVPTVLGAARLLKVLEELGFPRDRQRLLVNRYTGAADNLRPADVAQRLGRDIDHVLPFQRKLAVAANLGTPYILNAPRWWGFGRALGQLVADLEGIEPHRRTARAAPSSPEIHLNGTATHASAKEPNRAE